jgi:hypothetical protein
VSRLLAECELPAHKLADRIAFVGIDLGRKTGAAHITNHTGMGCCVEFLTPAEERRQRSTQDFEEKDPRYAEAKLWLSNYLNLICRDYDRVHVAFEMIQFATYRLQVQLWSTFRCALWDAIEWNQKIHAACRIQLFGVPVGTLKKFAGKGDFNKEGMRRAALERGFISKTDTDDNMIDAIWLAHWAKFSYTLPRR